MKAEFYRNEQGEIVVSVFDDNGNKVGLADMVGQEFNIIAIPKTVEAEPLKWQWNDGTGSRGRKPACLIAAPSGDLHRFTGKDIPGVIKVLTTKFEKNGKWSNTTFFCVSPAGTSVLSWRQDWNDGVFWPQASWEEAAGWVIAQAPQCNTAQVQAVIREHWDGAAKKFDDNQAAIAAMMP